MRELYESGHDRTKEAAAVGKFIERFGGGVDFFKLPIQYKLDFAIVRDGSVTSFIEVKCRKNVISAYPTYIISLSKMVAAAQYKDAGITCILLVQWADQMGWVKIPDNRWITKVGGRKDREDWQDIEPVVHIPIKEFKAVG